MHLTWQFRIGRLVGGVLVGVAVATLLANSAPDLSYLVRTAVAFLCTVAAMLGINRLARIRGGGNSTTKRR